MPWDSRQVEFYISLCSISAYVILEYNSRLCKWLFLEIKLSRVIKIENLTKYYGKVKALSSLNLDVDEGEIYAFIGPNGAGKTTLMKTLAAQLPPLQGAYTGDSKLRIGYFAQHQLDLLNPQWSPLDHLTDISDQENDRSLRTFLGRFGFSGAMATEPVAIRSGGETARLVLALIVSLQMH